MRLLTSLLLASAFCLTYAEPTNIASAHAQIRHYHDSGQYEQDIKQTCHQAERYLSQRIQLHQKTDRPLAIMLDVDESALSNYQSIGTLLNMFDELGDGFPEKELNTLRHPFRATAIQPTLALYHYARQHHVAVFFVTGRSETVRQRTKENLIKQGYGQWKQLILRQPSQLKQSAQAYKNHSAASIVSQGYDLVLSLGDQYSDLAKNHADRGFKLPNPYYHIN